jgi:hypothetical protein
MYLRQHLVIGGVVRSEHPFSLTPPNIWVVVQIHHHSSTLAVRHTEHVIWRILLTRGLKENKTSTRLTNRRISTPRMSELLQFIQAVPLLA